MRLHCTRVVTFAMLVSVSPAGAQGAHDPDRAQADANEILRDLHAFCERPRMPPSRNSVRLCSYADEVPNCQGFAAQCAAMLKQEEAVDPSPLWLTIARFIAKIAPALGWTALALGIATIVYLLAKAIWDRFRKPKDEVEGESEVEVTITEAKRPVVIDQGSPESILERAEAALMRGDLHAALFGFLHASLRALDVRGAIRITRDRTNGEYVRTCADENARPELRAIVREVDVVQFGGRSPELDRVREAGRRAAALVRGAVVATLLALFVVGCGSQKQSRANDPAGNEVARALLKRQGFTLLPPPVPLARLAAPKEEERPPPILLDLSRTRLDDDAVKGLERWVHGGGRLIMMGPVWSWPPPFRGSIELTDSRDVVVHRAIDLDCDDATDECEEKAAEALEKAEGPPLHARIAHGAAFKWPTQTGRPIAFVQDAKEKELVYASFGDFGSGLVLGVASADLLTNAGLAREGNPAALVAILSHLVPGADGTIHVVDEHGGITPSSNPLAALLKAGLGLPLVHVLLFVAVLGFAVGVRFRAPRPQPVPARRAFAEHVEATASLYAYAKAAPHALASYGRFVVERMRTRLSKGSDVATTLAHRSGASKEDCQRVLDRATLIKAGDEKRGDELATLRELCDIYTRAEGPIRETKSALRFGRRRGS